MLMMFLSCVSHFKAETRHFLSITFDHYIFLKDKEMKFDIFSTEKSLMKMLIEIYRTFVVSMSALF